MRTLLWQFFVIVGIVPVGREPPLGAAANYRLHFGFAD
jgi:hypothetical protein